LSKRNEISRRVARIHGHVHGINKMLDANRPYPEIAHQVIAVRAALDKVIQLMVDDLVKDCVSKAKGKGPLTDSLKELQAVAATI